MHLFFEACRSILKKKLLPVKFAANSSPTVKQHMFYWIPGRVKEASYIKLLEACKMYIILAQSYMKNWCGDFAGKLAYICGTKC